MDHRHWLEEPMVQTRAGPTCFRLFLGARLLSLQWQCIKDKHDYALNTLQFGTEGRVLPLCWWLRWPINSDPEASVLCDVVQIHAKLFGMATWCLGCVYFSLFLTCSLHKYKVAMYCCAGMSRQTFTHHLIMRVTVWGKVIGYQTQHNILSNVII